MIESTVTTARHKPTPKRSKKEPPIPAIVKIVGEPSLSSKDEGWYYFWAKHQNSKRKDWSILCTEEQIDWVVEQMQDNVQLIEGTHFADKRLRTEDGYVTRSVLAEEFQIDEPVQEENPMTWGEFAPVAQTPQEPVTDPIALETLRRYSIWNVCCQAVEIEPTEPQRCEAMRIFTSGTIIDSRKR
jgi:hypothetical protein